jgi:hypothetical protein
MRALFSVWILWPIVRVVRAIDRLAGSPYCRACGCTNHSACAGGCWWVKDDLCSACEWTA